MWGALRHSQCKCIGTGSVSMRRLVVGEWQKGSHSTSATDLSDSTHRCRRPLIRQSHQAFVESQLEKDSRAKSRLHERVLYTVDECSPLIRMVLHFLLDFCSTAVYITLTQPIWSHSARSLVESFQEPSHTSSARTSFEATRFAGLV